MPRALRIVLLLIPVGLVAVTAAVWIRSQLRTEHGTPPPRVEISTKDVAGIHFEVEHEMKEGVNLFASFGADSVRFSRDNDVLEYDLGLLTVNDIGMPEVKPGDTVRWNVSGPLLINGQPASPHPLQPRPIEAQNVDGQWQPLPGQYPRDTYSVAWAADSRRLVVAHGDGAVRVWDVDKGEVVRAMVPEAPKGGSRGPYGLRAAVSPDGKTIASTNSYGNTVTLWELLTGNKIATFSEPAGNVRGVAFLDDKTLLESRGTKLVARTLPDGKTQDLGAVHEYFAVPFAVSVPAKLIARIESGAIHVGPLGQPAVFKIEPISSGAIAAFSTDGTRLAVFDGDRKLTLYDAKTGAMVKPMRWRSRAGIANSINALAFSPDGLTLAAGDNDSVRLYDLPSGRERGGIAAFWVRSLAYSADGRTLASGLRYQPGLRLWKTEDLVAKPKEE
jgi:WD40 repeat protein